MRITLSAGVQRSEPFGCKKDAKKEMHSVGVPSHSFSAVE